MPRSYFQKFSTDDEITIIVEYHYEDDAPCIDDAWRDLDEAPVHLTDKERERMKTWISENRYYDDHVPDD